MPPSARKADSKVPEEGKCEKCGGTGWIETPAKGENASEAPVRVPCDCRKKDPTDESAEFIGRTILDAPERFWGA